MKEDPEMEVKAFWFDDSSGRCVSANVYHTDIEYMLDLNEFANICEQFDCNK